MKKVFGLLFLTVGLVAVGTAQQTHFGLKAGLNVANVENPDGPDYDSKSGLHFGGLAHIHLSHHFAVQPEVVFSMQGGEVDANDAKLNLNYINVPVLAQYMFNEGFRIETGPQVGFLVSASSKVGDVKVDREDDFKTVDFSWAFGAGYLFPQGIGIDARYNLGISNIYDGPGKLMNRVFQVGVFYQFMNGGNGKRK